MTKRTLVLALMVLTLGMTSTVASDNDDPWKAKDPFQGKTYEKEEVSPFAQVANKTTTVVAGVAMLAGATYYVVNHWSLDSIGVTVPFVDNQVNLFVPSLGTLGHTFLASNTLVFVGFPVDVALTYVAKKSAQGVEAVAKKGWKVVKYGYDMATFYWDDFRARHMQGTFFANRHATYVAKAGAQ
jgi:hypothetical protein